MILLTGATGLLGSHIAFELARSGQTFRAIKRNGSSSAALQKIFAFYSDQSAELLKRIEWVEADLLDHGSLEDAMSGITQVYHAAAIVSFHSKDRKSMLQTNIEGTSNLVNLCLQHNIKKFCHISSVASLGKQVNGRMTDENSWWKTSPENSWYAISKYGAEREVWRAKEEGLDVIILNPSYILGAGDTKRSSAEIFSLLKSGTRFFPAGATGYVDARDVARAAALLMNSGIRNERFVLNAANLTYKEFFDAALFAFGNPPATIRVGPFAGGIVWRAEKWLARFTGRKPRLTEETSRSAQSINRFDGSKVTRSVEFIYDPISKTISETARFFSS